MRQWQQPLVTAAGSLLLRHSGGSLPSENSCEAGVLLVGSQQLPHHIGHASGKAGSNVAVSRPVFEESLSPSLRSVNEVHGLI